MGFPQHTNAGGRRIRESRGRHYHRRTCGPLRGVDARSGKSRPRFCRPEPRSAKSHALMRILFDQGAPVPIAAYLREHSVRTALEEGWDTLANGDLLRVAEGAGFDVLLTADTNLAYQQNLKGRRIAIVVLSGNRWRLVQRVIRKI